ncbi:MAG TPA: cysteine--tRNA ligase [Terriglobales bacterium]|nr:cysteine--tRNA ligase [Terriglobales bacterium]
MPLRVFNTLSGRVEELKTLEHNRIRMYSCGPTVYDYGHIGNFRTFVFVDLFRRFLRQSGYQLDHVMNITDVDDKIIRNSSAKGLGVREYAAKYEQAFFEDMRILSLEKPEQIARATEHIPEMAALIARLRQRDFAYKTEDGSYYFPIAKFPAYGKLSKKDMTAISDGARVDVDEYEKDNVRDFALWKSPKPGEAKWETEIGPGRPGWHIECSAMAMEYLGETLDIHLGGEDLIFPHHENEIAQSEAATGKTFAHYWMHVRFLLVEGQKMSKSLGNFYTPRDLMLKNHKASSIRYLLSSVPYQKQLNFTFEGLKQAANSVERLRNFKLRLDTGNFRDGSNPELKALAESTKQKMRAALEDDMNTAQALGAVFDMVREANAAGDDSKLLRADVPELQAALQQFDEIFAVLKDDDAEKTKQVLQWARAEGKVDESAASAQGLTDAQVEALIQQRQQARKARDFAKADAVRKQLADAGIILEDTKDGLRWKRK